MRNTVGPRAAGRRRLPWLIFLATQEEEERLCNLGKGVPAWCRAVDYRRGARPGTDAGTVTDDDSRAARMSACVAQFVAAAEMNWLLP